MAFELLVNGTRHIVDADPQTPLLWVIRDYVGLTGTKFSCGSGQCGACTLHVDGRPVRSCSAPAATAIGKPVLTIEGISPDGSHPIQIAWKEFDAPQCGYCQSGMIGMGHDRATSVQSAFGDATFQITGKRLRDLPYSRHDLSWS